MRIPDFFIVGAPKCGTTALYHYISSHPHVFVPPQKEPHFFAADFPRFQQVSTEDEYRRLFSGARNDLLAGEGSVWYLYSSVAVPRILQANPRAKLLICLRNPVDMAISLHAQKRFSLDEDLNDFLEAWQAQQLRAKGCAIPDTCREPAHLQYRAVCSFPKQIERVYEHAPEANVFVSILEEFVRDPRREYLRVLDFLGLEDDGRADFPKVNPRSRRRIAWWPKMRRRNGMLVAAARPIVKRGLNALGLRPGRAFARWNRVEERAATIDPEVRAYLSDVFRDEIDETENVLRRRLDVWRSS